jgi:hypothetical protein
VKLSRRPRHKKGCSTEEEEEEEEENMCIRDECVEN